jgi:uncharacterized protein HemX
MAKRDTHRHDQERVRRVLEYQEKYEPKAKRPSAGGSCLLLFLALAAAAAVVYFVLTHRNQVARLFQKPPAPAVDTTPDGPRQDF